MRPGWRPARAPPGRLGSQGSSRPRPLIGGVGDRLHPEGPRGRGGNAIAGPDTRGPSLTPPPPGAFEAAKTAVMLSSIGLAAVISRLETGTFYNTKLPIIATLTSLVALVAL